jgi:hypothetical protein
MSRRVAAALTALAVLFVLNSSAAVGRSTSPVLGWAHAFQHGAGFGTATPRTVDLGGDPTGKVTSITWHDWGAARAVGFGQGWCPGQSVAAGHPCSAALHVSKLGTCHRRRAYLEIAFYFKNGPTWILGSKWNACTGQYEP